MQGNRAVVVGAGIGGLVTALDLASRGVEVTVLERAAEAGGKLRQVSVAGSRIDAGPTVFTMRWVFDQLFDDAGLSLAEHIDLRPAGILARHAWSAGERLDLYDDLAQSADAIGRFSGAAEARRFLDFSARARCIYEILEGPFIRSACASPQALVRSVGARRMPDLWKIAPFNTLWRALGGYFHDPRLRQLFGRYATYCGSSPFEAPATLMLIAHVEQAGVWLIEGGMHRLAQAIAAAASRLGAQFRYRAHVDEILIRQRGAAGVRLSDGEVFESDAVIVNADAAALSAGHFGTQVRRACKSTSRATRSLSAVTWAMMAETEGFPLLRHNVFFSGDYAAEFEDVFKRARLPASPTVYVCAQDRAGSEAATACGSERLLCLVNAPANGDSRSFDAEEIEQCQARTFDHLERCGLRLHRQAEATLTTTPQDFDRLFPASGGALYGPASHGWQASFNRPSARSRIAGLYLAGGSVHPGPGVPMAALSGRIAAASLMQDWDSNARSHQVAMHGGMSMR
jgi:1-hydroxycarotenoid 3,4-desaturase